jgi:hypothetical protein
MGRPVAIIAIGPDGVTVKPVVDVTKLVLAALTGLGGDVRDAAGDAADGQGLEDRRLASGADPATRRSPYARASIARPIRGPARSIQPLT